MKKAATIFVIVFVVSLAYLILTVTMPTLNELTQTANASLTATVDNLTNFPGTQETLISSPWVLWFVPGFIGIVLVVLVLRQGRS